MTAGSAEALEIQPNAEGALSEKHLNEGWGKSVHLISDRRRPKK